MVEVENKLQRYDSYKDSGVEWLGEIPEHWELTRLGTRFKERKTKVSDKDFPPLSVTKNGTVPQLANAAKSNDGDNRKLVKKGDFAINSRSDRKGSSGIAYQDGSVSLIYIVMEPLNIHPIYCNYLLKSYNFIEEFYRMGHGIVADLWTTRYDEMKAIMVGIPPLSEQTKIAQFLDDKTTKIEDAIAIKEQQINLLKERKQILIHKAVTRGLDDRVKLKDSGVEWIGEIPDHWEVKRLKNVCYINRNSLTETTNKDFRFRYVDIGSVSLEDGIVETEEFLFKNSPSRARRIAKPGDTVISTVRTYLKAIDFVNEEKSKYIYSTGFAVLEPESFIYPEFLANFVRSDAFTEQVTINSKGMSYPAINSTDLSRLFVVHSSISEQKEISAYIETSSQKIEKAIGLKQQEIDRLKEYKSSLINGVVTGKVKVC
ncbi:restriction endonuclease subunit S [Olleya namhaensis]|uniref:restriction endonuclease subunit S n=1 Tax=Olleya namhaensis TaxID=1144750 RepID=UPI002490AE24|nr:restriction endonuclease subunit S [Olleya namhaensis]